MFERNLAPLEERGEGDRSVHIMFVMLIEEYITVSIVMSSRKVIVVGSVKIDNSGKRRMMQIFEG